MQRLFRVTQPANLHTQPNLPEEALHSKNHMHYTIA